MSDLGIDALASEGHKPKHKHGRGCLAVLLAFAVVVGIGVFAYVKGVDFLQDSFSEPGDYEGQGRGSVVVQVRDGDTATDIGETLVRAKVVKSVEAFTDAAKADDRSLSIQVGFYELRRQMSAKSALDLLVDPDSRVSDPITIPEGLRTSEILARIVKQTDFSKREVQRAADNPARLGLPAYADGNLEGYLFPATYEVQPKSDAADLLAAMVDRFVAEADKLGLQEGARRLGVSPADVVTVASLVQAESPGTEDMPEIASVVYNRLDEGMPLQFDSTLHYAADSRGEVVAGPELRNIDSPYNTYRHAGLPPTPIASPGADALAAALDPADGDLLYFVTVNLATGETLFAETLPEHNRNREKYLEYCERSDEC